MALITPSPHNRVGGKNHVAIGANLASPPPNRGSRMEVAILLALVISIVVSLIIWG